MNERCCSFLISFAFTDISELMAFLMFPLQKSPIPEETCMILILSDSLYIQSFLKPNVEIILVKISQIKVTDGVYILV